MYLSLDNQFFNEVKFLSKKLVIKNTEINQVFLFGLLINFQFNIKDITVS